MVSTPKGRGDAAARTRRLSLDAGTVEALRRHRAAQLQERLAVGALWVDEGLVFCREDGLPSTRRASGSGSASGLGTPGSPTSACTTSGTPTRPWRWRPGIHPKVVSERLGHANIGITLNLYSHVSEGMDREAADVVAALFT